MTTTVTTNKPFHIEKKRVYEAYKAVRSNRGAAGRRSEAWVDIRCCCDGGLELFVRHHPAVRQWLAVHSRQHHIERQRATIECVLDPSSRAHLTLDGGLALAA